MPFYGYNRPTEVSDGVRQSFWLQGMLAGNARGLFLHQSFL